MKVALALIILAQISIKPADVVVPVVGSTRGISNANFKTELQLHNATSTAMTGWLVLRPHQTIHRYELAPFATVSFADVVGDQLDTIGLGSLDVFVDRGGVPTVVARAFDDQPTGTTGVSVPVIRANEVLTSGDVRTLLVPRDLTRYRSNLGLRVFEQGATIELTIRDASGTQRHFRSLTYTTNSFDQQPADILAGTTLRANDSIEVHIAAGSAIVYATTVDNQTNDSAIQVLRK